ncbi:hypothetical protein [Pelosinus sp. UFO1]|uniref:hypothetical protein n=1 Tax=Pelosinus sp. UFO1 TaxID=484770 RepID=UPI0004D0D630|nr:hypothetical protein [Pelosinus sp. UFO1]AIF52815.1 hypothetical protein UFO1_3272 [Pelosinus sp. UFO1]
MKKWLVMTLVLMMSFTGSVFAWSGSANIEGKPDQFQMSGAKGYYIWQDEYGFHIWTTTRSEEHTFTGVIRTNGNFHHIRPQSLERGDAFRVSDEDGKPWLRSSEDNRRHFSFGGREINSENDKIQFRFATTGGSDGINFRVENASFIDFDLFIDGRPIPRREIYISDSGWHPQSHKFRLVQ